MGYTMKKRVNNGTVQIGDYIRERGNPDFEVLMIGGRWHLIKRFNAETVTVSHTWIFNADCPDSVSEQKRLNSRGL
jgi:hypothetical protein